MAITFNQPSTDIIQSGDNIGLLKKAFAETPTTTQPVENYNIPKSFDASTLNNITTPVVPQTPTPPATDSFVKSLEASNKQIQDLVASYNQPTDQLAGEQTGLFAKLQETIAKQGTQGTRLTEEQAKLQVPENITKLQDINTQITQKMNEYNARVAALPGQGRGITTGIIQGQTDREKRLAATEIGALSSIAQTLQGNIALAQQTAKDTVDAEFAPYETEIKQLQTLIEANKDRMTTAEKRRAEQVQITLDERARLLGEQKTERNNVLALAQEAAKNGADNTTIQNILSKKTTEEATQSAGSFLSSPTKEFGVIGQQYDENTGTFKNVYGFIDKNKGTVSNISGQNVGTTGSYSTGGSISYRTNNPGNIKWTGSDWQKALGATDSGIKATDGGTFALFPTLEAGTQAQKNLLTSSSYANLTLDQAMKRWSNSGYGADVSPTIPKNTLMKDLSETQLSTLMEDMKKREGFTAPSETQDTTNLDNALSLIKGSGKFTKEQTKSLTDAIKNGEDPFTVVKNQAKNIMGQTMATDLDKYEVAKEQLVSIQNLLNDYYAKGGKTNLLTGNYEKVINKLGEVNDPNLVSIATNIQAALQIYRNAVSGTAYSVQEGKDISAIFPGINKSQGLNEAIVKGRLQAFDTTIDAKYKSTLGSVYSKLKDQYGEQKTGLDKFITEEKPQDLLSEFIR